MILDETDYKIIELLTQDARLPAQEIANKTDKHLTTITRRIKSLEQEGIIKGYTAVVDYEKLGLELTVITQLTFVKGKLFEAEKAISEIPGVCSVYDVTGKIDAIVTAKFKSKNEISSFAKKLLAMPFVDRTETHIVLNTIKEDFRIANITSE